MLSRSADDSIILHCNQQFARENPFLKEQYSICERILIQTRPDRSRFVNIPAVGMSHTSYCGP